MSKDDSGLPTTKIERGITKIKLDVTEEDLKTGIPANSDNCVVAVCLRRLGYKDIEVMPNHAYVGKIGYWFTPELTEYVLNFDRKDKLDPCTFVIYNEDDRLASPKLGRPKVQASNTQGAKNEEENHATVG